MSAVIKVDFLGDATSATRASQRTRAALGQVDTAADKTTRSTARLSTALGSMAKRFGPIAAAAGGAALVKFGADAVGAASRVEQAMGAIDAVFGKSAGVVKQWAADAATSVGLAKSEYGELASVTGSMLKNTGIEDYANETRRLIALGSDLAATYGGPTKQAVEALGSLLRGETDPIERYGVSIKQSDVNARLASEGLGKLTGEARKQAEQQARLALLFDQTKDAQGAFARESGTLAGQQQRLSAAWENISAAIGGKLLPVATEALEWLNETVTGGNRVGEVLRTLGEIYGTYMSPILEAFRDHVGRVVKALNDTSESGDGLRRAGQKVLELMEKWAPVMGEIVAGAIGFMSDAIVGAIEVIDWFADRIGDLIGFLKDMIGWVDDAIDKLEKLKDVASTGLGFGFGGLFNVLRSGDPLPGGLGRADGFGAFGGGYGINVAAPKVTSNTYLRIDGRDIEPIIERTALYITRREIGRQVRLARSP